MKEITINLSDSELSKDDINLIKDCLQLNGNVEVDEAMKRLCKSAFMEYIKMFKEKGIPSRADEVKQERLYFLILYYFEQKLPNENEISTIFQLTSSESKTLLKNTKSRYRTKINLEIINTLIETLKSAILNDDVDAYEFVCTSASTIDELNMIVNKEGPTLEPITKIRGSSAKFSCAVDTYNLLIDVLEI